MTQVFQEDGTRVPVTVIEAGPCTVTALRVPDRDGYEAIQLAFDEVSERKLTKAQLGHLAKADAPPSRTLVEFRDEAGERQVGDKVTVEDVEAGEKVKVSGTGVGKGVQGTIKRHGFSRGPVSHGSHTVPAPGSVGASAAPARVWKGMKMPGRMGGRRVTQRRAEVVQIDAENNLLLVRGGVPGPKGGTVEVR